MRAALRFFVERRAPSPVVVRRFFEAVVLWRPGPAGATRFGSFMVSSIFVPNGKRFLVFGANDTTQFTVTPSRLAAGGYGMAAVGTF